jgi:membrane protease YdiL (CAAX protease family)
MWTALVGVTIGTLVSFRIFPGRWLSDKYHLSDIAAYVPIALIFFIAVHFFGLPTLQYFRLPGFSLKTVFAILVASPLALGAMFNAGNEYKSMGLVASGAIYVLFIGFGEEMLSRGFVFGVLSKFGRYRAMFFSSLMFGLMHINVYFPDDLGWVTYWHVMSTFGFGLVMCALMIVTRSIWVPVVFHALSDWSIPFEKVEPEGDETWVDDSSLFDNLILPFFDFGFYVLAVVIIFWINRMQPTKWMYRLATKWKLIKPDYGLSA